jgi:hypothetical protein
MVEWEVFFQSYNHARIITRSLNPDAFHLLVCGSYGDVFPNFALLNAVVQHHKHPVVVLVSERWSSLTTRFQFDNVTYALIKDEQGFKNSLMSESRPYIFMPGWLYPLLPTMHPLLSDLIFDGYVTDFELKKVILRLPKETQYILTPLPKQRLNELKERIDSANCRLGKTCILSFENNSNAKLPDNLLIEIVNVIQKHDIDIALNTASTFNKQSWVPPEIDYLPKVQVPEDAPNEFIELAGAHLGTINGLTAILANFKTNAKQGLIADLSNPMIINNGRELLAESWLLLSKVALKDICIDNDYKEFIYHPSIAEDFKSHFTRWVADLSEFPYANRG